MARRYTRDNRGRFASTGATARGGRLRTASGGKREWQTMKAAGAGGAGVMKGAVRRDPGAMAKVGKAAPTRAQQLQARAESMRQRAESMMDLGSGRRDGAIVNMSLNSRTRAGSISQGLRGLELSRKADRLSEKARNIETRAKQSAAKAARMAANPKKVRSADSLRMSRAKQIEKRRAMKIDNLPQATLGKRARNSAKTQAAALSFYKGKGRK